MSDRLTKRLKALQLGPNAFSRFHFLGLTVELVGIDLSRALKTGKLLICGRSQSAQNAEILYNPKFIVRLLYGGFLQNQKQSAFESVLPA